MAQKIEISAGAKRVLWGEDKLSCRRECGQPLTCASGERARRRKESVTSVLRPRRAPAPCQPQ